MDRMKYIIKACVEHVSFCVCRISKRLTHILAEGQAEKRTCMLIQNFLEVVCCRLPSTVHLSLGSSSNPLCCKKISSPL